MPDITVVHIGLLTLAAVVGIIAGWVMRGNRCAQEKLAVNSGWQEQLEAQRSEHDRLLGQNKNLMEQVSQNLASHKDATNRAKELSSALKEVFGKRDELQREIKDVRNTLEAAVGERDKLQADMQSQGSDTSSTASTLQEKDDKILKLSRDLDNWQGRLPPLIERYKIRNEEAEKLEADLEAALARIQKLESPFDPSETLVETVDAAPVSAAMDASNDAVEDGVEEDAAEDLIEESTLEAYVDEELNAYDTINSRDDLKQIKGIGPAIEKTLHELGIFRFDQIAEMNEYDIDRIAQRLKGFRSRIYREDWIGQARTLHDQLGSEPA
jgi:predicted flap endonuclease-1-like 5' DNA nuclease